MFFKWGHKDNGYSSYFTQLPGLTQFISCLVTLVTLVNNFLLQRMLEPGPARTQSHPGL